MTVTIGTPGDFSLDLAPKTQHVMLGGTATYTMSVTAVTQPIGAVTLAPLELGSGLRATFDPAVVMPGETSTVTLSAGQGSVAGSQFFSLEGSAEATLHTAVAAVVVDVPDAATFDAFIYPDARPHANSAGEDSPAGACALAGQGHGQGGSGLIVLGLFVGLGVIARRRAP